MAITADLFAVAGRAAEFTGAYGNTRTKPERVDDLARAKLCAHAAQQQLELFAHWCYEQNDSHLLHICNNGQIPSGVFTPWGASGKSGLTRTERDVLRVWLYLVDNHGHNPPWLYLDTTRRWYVDLTHYPVLEDTLLWIQHHSFHPQDWLDIHLRMRRNGARSVAKYAASRKQVGRNGKTSMAQ